MSFFKSTVFFSLLAIAFAAPAPVIHIDATVDGNGLLSDTFHSASFSHTSESLTLPSFSIPSFTAVPTFSSESHDILGLGGFVSSVLPEVESFLSGLHHSRSTATEDSISLPTFSARHYDHDHPLLPFFGHHHHHHSSENSESSFESSSFSTDSSLPTSTFTTDSFTTPTFTSSFSEPTEMSSMDTFSTESVIDTLTPSLSTDISTPSIIVSISASL